MENRRGNLRLAAGPDVRSLVRQEASWDLLATVVLAGAVSTFYLWRHKVLTGRSFKLAAVSFVVAGVVAALIAWSLS
jgi:hypothetical protein